MKKLKRTSNVQITTPTKNQHQIQDEPVPRAHSTLQHQPQLQEQQIFMEQEKSPSILYIGSSGDIITSRPRVDSPQFPPVPLAMLLSTIGLKLIDFGVVDREKG